MLFEALVLLSNRVKLTLPFVYVVDRLVVLGAIDSLVQPTQVGLPIAFVRRRPVLGDVGGLDESTPAGSGVRLQSIGTLDSLVE